jgi:hypothetical protein
MHLTVAMDSNVDIGKSVGLDKVTWLQRSGAKENAIKVWNISKADGLLEDMRNAIWDLSNNYWIRDEMDVEINRYLTYLDSPNGFVVDQEAARECANNFLIIVDVLIEAYRRQYETVVNRKIDMNGTVVSEKIDPISMDIFTRYDRIMADAKI